MKANPKISAAVAAILSASNTAMVFAAPADTATTTATSGELQEVTVTAQRRSENIQSVPITIQAITGAQLKELNVTTFNDLLKYTPNVTSSGNGPGTGNVFMRGLGGSGFGNQLQGTVGPFPNVALYLDDQSMQFPNRNNDVYMVDMERVEVLEGPQGTLFGGGAQAGAIRYITNVPATIAFLPGSPAAVSGGNPTANNYNVLQTNSNPVDVQGFRLSGLYKINDDWNLLIQQNYQDMRADGYSYAYPVATDGAALAHNQITAFTPAYNKDRYESTAWTLSGKIGDLKAVYAGSYMVRHIDEQQDYSNYVRNPNGAYYYGCIGAAGALFGPAYYPQLAGHKLQCYAPVGNWHDSVQNQHQSHELRVSTKEDYRLRGLFGAYWEKFVIDDQVDLNYMSIPQCNQANLAKALAGGPDCVSAVGPVPGAFATDPRLRTNLNNAFGVDSQRGYKQTAFFASLDFDIIPKVLTVTGGIRHYNYNEFEEGSEWFTADTGSVLPVNHLNGVCTAAGRC